ncbi:DNA repair protein RecN [candidate division KSB1 bacterium 4484_188]|nr:MAG: DNA repair protein RecN [candidate division KSB1 bacterium 4484_188]
MLKHLHIRNFAVAQNVDIDFQNGLNIITGETGAGKSILVGAISAVLGGRVFTEVVRTGAEKATVEAIFDIRNLPQVQKKLSAKGLQENHELFLRREIFARGNTRAFVNDVPVTVSTVAEIGDYLVDIHGQNQHQSLLRKETHRYFLDAFGKAHSLLEKVSQAYARLRSVESELRKLENRKKELEEKYELFQFQLNEIEQAHLTPGEEEKLESDRRILMNTEKIFSLAGEFNQIVNSSERPNLQELMGQALHVLRELSEFSGELSTIFQEFSSAKIIVEESSRIVEEFQSNIEYNPVRLEEIEQRLAAISQLKKKYGGDIEEILEYRDRIKSQLNLKENFDFELGKLQESYQSALEIYADHAWQLSQSRKKVAASLEQRVRLLLQKIGMPKTSFTVKFDWIEDPNGIFHQDHKQYFADEFGVDQVEFYISPNPGEEDKPLTKIASGGEVSRIMLALKNILADVDRIPLLIFDEIDIGVSGHIALAVGKNIRKLTQSHQIICITHLPQIASFGNAHYRVEKFIKDGRTFTHIYELKDEERIEEIARLMGGKQLTDSILQSARDLMKEAVKE